MQNVLSLEKTRCTGCGACDNICPCGAIAMVPDEEGFRYPKTDAKKCQDCCGCVKVCPVINPAKIQNNFETFVYAAWSLDYETRYNSTSGGIFTELAKEVITNGGIVAGAKYDENHVVCHAMIKCREDLSKLRQSKYAQSDTNTIYSDVKKVLDAGWQVLFVGAPCQCAAMKSYVKQTDKLILCDFICRGVNSPLVYAKYLEELEKQYGSKTKQVWFKNKTNGWNFFGTRVDFENGKTYFGSRDEDPFMYGYIKKGLNLYMRPSCGQCEFKGENRPTDITLGDFWGVRLRESKDDTKNGVSVVMTNTEVGHELFHAVKMKVYWEEHGIEEVKPSNQCLEYPAPINMKNRSTFWNDFIKLGFIEAMKKYRFERNYKYGI